jgi:hypothetical protein
MKYIHSQETLDIPEGVKVNIKARIVTVEGPRGTLFPRSMPIQQIGNSVEKRVCTKGQWLTWRLSFSEYRKTCQEPWSHLRLLLKAHGKPHQHRFAPRLAQECRYPKNRPYTHQQHDHWRHQRIQVQDALRLCTFPHQCQHRQEQRDGSVRG